MPFSVYSLRDVRNLRVSVSELRSGSYRIGPEDLDLRLVTEWAMRYPRYTSDTYRRIPELLEAVTRNSFPAHTSQRYWLTVRTPDNAPAGLYTGTVTLYDDISDRATRLPVRFRVLDFRLQRDPAKRYSVYYYDLHYQFPGMTNELLARAMHNDYTAMQEHGIDMFPTIPLMETFNEQGQPEVAIRNPQAIDKMIEMGFQGPIPLIGGIPHFYRTFVPGGTRGGHWVADKFPETDDLYHAVEAAFRKLRLDFEARGWPEPVVCPMDEVAVTSAEFAARVNAAIRRAGIRTYKTKDPTAPDAEIYRRLDALDVWCSQPFALPYDQIVSDTRYEYWSYPNHNAGERKDRDIMHRGGRMTYGYGLWRSGYTTLIPWHWRWKPGRQDGFDYLSGPRTSGCGTRMDEEGNVIPAVYWSCFREGYDDLRYLYTLQQAVHDRRDATDPRVRVLVEEGLALIQEIWNSVPAEKLYLANNSWSDEQFAATRWRIARLISALQAFPAPDRGHAPSVMADPESASESAP
ncbi:MAG: hypothetical protein U1E27_11510, partial [Kiritimatiellia bacterium]|nr:hypothetical protein [Kiritimatiellia bacterium]